MALGMWLFWVALTAASAASACAREKPASIIPWISGERSCTLGAPPGSAAPGASTERLEAAAAAPPAGAAVTSRTGAGLAGWGVVAVREATNGGGGGEGGKTRGRGMVMTARRGACAAQRWSSGPRPATRTTAPKMKQKKVVMGRLSRGDLFTRLSTANSKSPTSGITGRPTAAAGSEHFPLTAMGGESILGFSFRPAAHAKSTKPAAPARRKEP
eukprot:scaffold11571_cov119-Isochrysis_galbana.AAC.15